MSAHCRTWNCLLCFTYQIYLPYNTTACKWWPQIKNLVTSLHLIYKYDILRRFELFITRTRNCPNPDSQVRPPRFASRLLPAHLSGWSRDERAAYRRHLGWSAGSSVIRQAHWPTRYQRSRIIANVVVVVGRPPFTVTGDRPRRYLLLCRISCMALTRGDSERIEQMRQCL